MVRRAPSPQCSGQHQLELFPNARLADELAQVAGAQRGLHVLLCDLGMRGEVDGARLVEAGFRHVPDGGPLLGHRSLPRCPCTHVVQFPAAPFPAEAVAVARGHRGSACGSRASPRR